ncbi:39S ribosomal protein L30, mitochondrial isoform X2 [Psammomys obesus]|uniref:39S ribosomal protein L30, mitochondrial isoform X2 n=1 Tax=Psammomys obesus TaxID=48139 RepID=UPI002452AFCF|nr:39S ribosomal protein L30, mitochondrial isoform X2 [Psammomys obesus]
MGATERERKISLSRNQRTVRPVTATASFECRTESSRLRSAPSGCRTFRLDTAVPASEEKNCYTMAGVLRSVFQRPPDRLQVFQPRPEDHEKYGGDPQNPHKLHIVTRIKSTKRRPYWEKDTIKMLGLQKAHSPQIHKNIPSVNAKLKVVKHLIRIQPLKLPQGLPTEENMSSTCLKSTGELVMHWRLMPVEQETKS